MRTDSDRNLSAEADPNPARKTRERVLTIQEVNLYNLMIVGEDVHLISQDNNVFNCYYPEKFSFKLQPNESVSVISDGKVYLEAWIEEGWDDENDRASEDYKYYDKVIVKDFEGNTISEEVGSIYQAPDGTYWIA